MIKKGNFYKTKYSFVDNINIIIIIINNNNNSNSNNNNNVKSNNKLIEIFIITIVLAL